MPQPKTQWGTFYPDKVKVLVETEFDSPKQQAMLTVRWIDVATDEVLSGVSMGFIDAAELAAHIVKAIQMPLGTLKAVIANLGEADA